LGIAFPKVTGAFETSAIAVASPIALAIIGDKGRKISRASNSNQCSIAV
jgi:hypothetical protein